MQQGDAVAVSWFLADVLPEAEPHRRSATFATTVSLALRVAVAVTAVVMVMEGAVCEAVGLMGR